MAPVGPRVLVQLVPRKLFHFEVQGKRKLPMLAIVFLNRGLSAAAPRANRFAFYTTDNFLSLRPRKNHNIPARRYPR
jgi:hypothetical protein